MLTLSHPSSPPSLQAASLAERRRGLRIRQCRPVKMYEPRSCRYFPGQTADISASGLRVKLPLSMPIVAGSTLSLHIGFDKRGNPLATRHHMLDARVIWTRREQNSGGSSLIAGLELLSMAAVRVDAA